MGRAKVSIHSPTKMGFSEVKAGVLLQEEPVNGIWGTA